MAPVFGLSNLGRRLVESVVGLFAILGFVYVPLGRHTGFEHARAVLSTPAAASAIDDLTTTALDLRQRVVSFVTGRASSAAITDADGPNAEASPGPHPPRREPRPVPPKLR
jgi:hypothetical protein